MGDLIETTSEKDSLITYKSTISNAPMTYIISVTKLAFNLENNIDTLLTSSVKSFSQAVEGSISETKEISLNGAYALLYLQEKAFRLD